MAVGDYTIPRPNSPFSEGGQSPTHEWYNYLRFLGQGGGTAALQDEITTISFKLGSPDGTPANIPPLSTGGIVQGIDSIKHTGALPNVVQLSLVGDVLNPGNTYYYGTNGSGNKGFYTVASAFLGTAGDIDLTVAGNGVTTIDLATVTFGTAGTLQAITLDNKGRVVQTHAVTITGASNRVTVANGDASAGQPTIDIAATYVGQTSITTVGTITTGTWNGSTIGPTFGGTGLNTYAAGDLIYGSATNVLARRAIGSAGQILTVVGGVPTWANPATSGTVTSVDVSGGTTGLTTTGGPITSSGTITLSGTLNIANGGTGQTTANAAFNALSPMTTNGDLIYRSGGVAIRLPIGSTGQVLGVTGGLPVWQAAAAGSVTSVGLAMPTQFTVTNSPVTSTGTLTAAWNTQAANTALMGPASGAAAVPTFRVPGVADTTQPLDFISGLKLIWNSATSISVGTGEAVIPSTGRTEIVSSTLTLSSLSLSASTFYHVYLFDTAGTPTIECVTTAPATPYQGAARAKTGDTTRRYVGSVRTDASGNVLNFFHVPSAGTIRYISLSNAAPFVVVSGGVATTPTSVSCAACVPLTSRLMMAATRNSDPSGAVLLTTSDSGFTLSASNFSDNIPPMSGTSGYISLDNSQAFLYMYGSAPTGSLISRVSGYVFDR